MMPDYGGGGEDPRSLKSYMLLGCNDCAQSIFLLFTIGTVRIRLWFDLEKKCPVGYYYDIVVDSELPDYLFDTDDVYSECEI